MPRGHLRVCRADLRDDAAGEIHRWLVRRYEPPGRVITVVARRQAGYQAASRSDQRRRQAAVRPGQQVIEEMQWPVRFLDRLTDVQRTFLVDRTDQRIAHARPETLVCRERASRRV